MGSEFWGAFLAIVVHVLNYNGTAQLEYNTRIFTKVLGSNAIYYYAVYLIASALVRDHFIYLALETDKDSLVLLAPFLGTTLSYALKCIGIGLNLWTLKALGIKGMYNGDSFGFLMKEIVNSGPYQYFSDPQYVGTTLACLGYAVEFQSWKGYILSAWLWVVFQFSVKFIEGPHMKRIYSQGKSSSNSASKKEGKKKS